MPKPCGPVVCDCVKAFVDWLYETGPDPSTLRRSRLLYDYQMHLDGPKLPRYVSPAGTPLARLVVLDERRRQTRPGTISAPRSFTPNMDSPDEPA